jgi:hypothetical protein
MPVLWPGAGASKQSVKINPLRRMVLLLRVLRPAGEVKRARNPGVEHEGSGKTSLPI